MFSESLQMIKKDRNLCNFNIVDFVGCILWTVHWLLSVPSAPRIIFYLRDFEKKKKVLSPGRCVWFTWLCRYLKCPFQFNIIHSVNYSYNQSHSPKIHKIELKSAHTFPITPAPCWRVLGAKNCGSWYLCFCGLICSVFLRAKFFVNSNNLIQINFPQTSNLHILNTAIWVKAI
jgi:hypothetical protein